MLGRRHLERSLRIYLVHYNAQRATAVWISGPGSAVIACRESPLIAYVSRGGDVPGGLIHGYELAARTRIGTFSAFRNFAALTRSLRTQRLSIGAIGW